MTTSGPRPVRSPRGPVLSCIGYSQHAGMVAVADGTDLAAQKLERVLTSDPGMGVVRQERGLHIPMLDG